MATRGEDMKRCYRDTRQLPDMQCACAELAHWRGADSQLKRNKPIKYNIYAIEAIGPVLAVGAPWLTLLINRKCTCRDLDASNK
jgi:hypothetical protein